MSGLLKFVWRLGMLFGFVGGLAASIAWWVFMPHGFPLDHPRFWTNDIAPGIGCLVFGLGIYAGARDNRALLRWITLFCVFAAFGAGVTAKLIFPISVSGLLLTAVVCVCGFAMGIWIAAVLIPPKSSLTWKSGLAATGALCGVFLTCSQRGLPPETQPDPSAQFPAAAESATPITDIYSLDSETLRIIPAAAEFDVTDGESVLSVRPLLSFHSRSPDRCWTLFAPWEERSFPERRLIGLPQQAGDSIVMHYEDDGRSQLRLTELPGGALRIEGHSQLKKAVYSHLNTFCELQVTGPGVVSLTFSPCPDSPVEVVPMDYPFGRPIRAAYLDEQNRFRVVEASNGEKGPFHTLAEGDLKRGDRLTISVSVGGRLFKRVTLDGWSAQASTQLSPTAGWGLPENAIEFSSLDGARNIQIANIFITLASTSLGRGYDSVGHAPGIYRNEILIE